MNAGAAARRGRMQVRQVMTDRVKITRGAWPDVTTVGTSVPAWIRPSAQATTELSSGGQTVALRAYQVRMPMGTDVQRDDVLTVMQTNEDALEGRYLTVVHVVVGTEQVSRTAVCHEAVA